MFKSISLISRKQIWCTAAITTLVLGIFSVTSTTIAQEKGVTDNEVLLGQTAALTGPTSALGLGMKVGLETAIREANDAGGVHGRKLRLISYDDGYEPNQAITNTEKLIREDQVFSIIGTVGTPTAKALQPMTTEAGVPLIGPFTGAGFLRDKANRNVINLRATYNQETEEWVERLVTDMNAKRIALLFQDDAFGRVGLAGVTAALEKRGMTLAAQGAYERNTVAVRSALLTIRKSKPDAIVIVGAYKPAAEFIRLAKRLKLNVPFINISFVGSKALAQDLGTAGEGVFVTQVVPLPWNASVPLVAQYQAAMKKYQPDEDFGFVSLEGYAVGQLAIEALKRTGQSLTREAFLNAIYNTGPYDLGGLLLEYSEGDNQGANSVFMTKIGASGDFTQVLKLTN